MEKTLITKHMAVMFVASNYPTTREVFEEFNIPWRDQRVPPWIAIIQSLAQKNIWYEDGFVPKLRAALPPDDPLQKLDDLTLLHEKTRDLANYPTVRLLLEKHGVLFNETPVIPWEPIEQAAARRGVWPVDNLVEALNQAVEKGRQQ